MAEHPNVARLRDGYAAFANCDFITASRGGGSLEVNEAHVFHLRDGKVVEFWNASTDQYANDEFLG